MKNLVPLALTVVTQVALAAPPVQPAVQPENQKTNAIHCTFTEPFFSLHFDLKKREVLIDEPNLNNGGRTSVTRVIAKGIRVRTHMSDPFLPKYSVLTSSGKLLASLTLDVQGSDGMSDIISPFSIKYENWYGGCSSNQIKEINPNEK